MPEANPKTSKMYKPINFSLKILFVYFLSLAIDWCNIYTNIYNKWQTLLLAYSKKFSLFKSDTGCDQVFIFPPGGHVLPSRQVPVAASVWGKASWWIWANHGDLLSIDWHGHCYMMPSGRKRQEEKSKHLWERFFSLTQIYDIVTGMSRIVGIILLPQVSKANMLRKEENYRTNLRSRCCLSPWEPSPPVAPWQLQALPSWQQSDCHSWKPCKPILPPRRKEYISGSLLKEKKLFPFRTPS